MSSGFTHAKTNVSEIRRVLQIKGRRNVRALEVDMNWSSFNQGDCFIIEIDNVRTVLVVFFVIYTF